MIHKACMPVYMNPGKIVADGRVGKSKVLQEVLADLKKHRVTGSPIMSSIAICREATLRR